ncbi:M1-specific T cell receptor beta chain-like isoform X2 [Osmerus mordax]|uniref:M1-specific T cell receptor beta chain-like isoform X2 n=1 Tax=Osmerus mordax TaxID=8014 RepID=UPI00350EBD1B
MFPALTISVFALWHTGWSQTVLITQWPGYISSQPDASVKMHCYQNNTDHHYMSWYRQQRGKEPVLMATLVAGSPSYEPGFDSGFGVSSSEKKMWSLAVEAVRITDEAVYLCAATTVGFNEAYFGNGTKLTVLDPDISDKAIQPNVTVLTPSIHECKDAKDNKNKKTLVCVATGFYPDHVSVSWKINGENVFDGVGTDNSAVWNNETKYSITSRLRVPAGVWYTDSNEFNCTVLFFNGTEYIPFEASVMGDKAPSTGGMTTENYVKSTQTAKLAYIVFIAKSSLYGFFVVVFVWKLQGKSGKHFT